MAYSSHGSPDNKGTVSYLLEDSWPRLYIVLGWEARSEAQVEVVLSVADTHLRYEKLMERELNGLVMKVRVLATIHYKIKTPLSQADFTRYNLQSPVVNLSIFTLNSQQRTAELCTILF